MQRPRPIKITDLNPHLMCVLCGGYYIDATTIIECLHSFCKSCIVRYLETNKYCPICDVQVHKTKPLLNIRQDQTLQNIVYKLVPGLYQNELKYRREFYSHHPESTPRNSEDAGELSKDSHLFLPDEAVSLSLEYHNTSSVQEECRRRYLQCPAAVTVYHLQKLVRAKFGLSKNHKIEVMYAQDYLPDYLSLIDIAYIYQWKRKSPIHLTYHILECQRKKMKLSHEPENTVGEISIQNDNSIINIQACASGEPKKDTSEKNQVPIQKTEPSVEGKLAAHEWKEVQLQISENGVMSVTDVQPVPREEHVTIKNQVDKNGPLLVNSVLSDTRPEEKCSSSLDFPPCDNSNKLNSESVTIERIGESKLDLQNEENSESTKNKGLDNDSTKCKYKSHETIEPRVSTLLDVKSPQTDTKYKPTNKDSLPVSNNTSFKSSIPENKSASLSVNIRPVGFQKVYPGIKSSQSFQTPSKDIDQKKGFSSHASGTNQSVCQEESRSSISQKLNQSARYRTLKCPTKPWNPSIPRSTTLSMKPSEATNHSKHSTSEDAQTQLKQPRFFKMRNMPRFLGNPASGVKPMYQVAPGSELGSQPSNTTPRSPKQGNTSITLMKIDPKTLSPIAMTPSTPPPINSQRTNSSPIPSSKFPPPFTPSSPKHHSNHFQNCRTHPHLQTNKKKSLTPRIPSPAHAGSLMQSNPFLASVPHSVNPHMLYSGYPGTFSPTDPTGNNRLLTGSSSQLIRAMSALCPPNAAFHPSLPPSISMLFNPHHAHHRLSQSEKSNFKPVSNESQKIPTPPPTVQRIPPSSGPNVKSSSEGSHFTKLPEQKVHQINATTEISESGSILQNTKLNAKSNHLPDALKKHSLDSVSSISPVTLSAGLKTSDSTTYHDLNNCKETSQGVNGPVKEEEKLVSKKDFVNSAVIQPVNGSSKDSVNSFKEKNNKEVKSSVSTDSKKISVKSSLTINSNSEKLKKTGDINLVTDLINRVDAPNYKS